MTYVRLKAEFVYLGVVLDAFVTAPWVQVWVPLKMEKWLPISRKRHQIGQLDFRSFRLLTKLGTNREQIGNKLPKNTREIGRTTHT